MKRWEQILFRITIVSSILAFLFFTLAPLNELRQGNVGKAEKLLLFPVELSDPITRDVLHYLDMPHKFVTTKSVALSILSGVLWGMIIWIAFVTIQCVLYPIVCWILNNK